MRTITPCIHCQFTVQLLHMYLAVTFHACIVLHFVLQLNNAIYCAYTDKTGQRMLTTDAQKFDNITVCGRRESNSPIPYRMPFLQSEYEVVLAHINMVNNGAHSFNDVASRSLFYRYVPPKVSPWLQACAHFRQETC